MKIKTLLLSIFLTLITAIIFFVVEPGITSAFSAIVLIISAVAPLVTFFVGLYKVLFSKHQLQ